VCGCGDISCSKRSSGRGTRDVYDRRNEADRRKACSCDIDDAASNHRSNKERSDEMLVKPHAKRQHEDATERCLAIANKATMMSMSASFVLVTAAN